MADVLTYREMAILGFTVADAQRHMTGAAKNVSRGLGRARQALRDEGWTFRAAGASSTDYIGAGRLGPTQVSHLYGSYGTHRRQAEC